MIAMNVPEDREYTRSHEWILMDDASAVVGLAANDPAGAGEIKRIELPQADLAVKVGDNVVTIVFANATRPVYAPLSGSIIEVNSDLESHPELLKQDPYGAGWLFRLKVEAGEEIEHLLSSAAYGQQLRAAEAMDIEVP
jgi:glycine cleavage system H protein